MSPSQNELAQRLRALCIPGKPVVFANVWDGATASIVCSLPHTKAVTTASYAIAETYGVRDPELTRAQNLDAIGRIGRAVTAAGLPFAADLQDGYADIGSTIREAVALGVVGANIEDCSSTTGQLYPVDEAVARIHAAREAARDAGVPDFVVNARTDTLVLGGSVDEAIERGKRYLAAGAVTVYTWGGSKRGGITRDEVRKLSEALGGMINVKLNLRPGEMTVKEIADAGVARISVGPELYQKAMAAFTEAAETVV